MSLEFNDIEDLHRRFDLGFNNKVSLLSEEQQKFRHQFLEEEVREFQEAYERGDLYEALDALVDIVVVAYGTAILMGVREDLWNQLWDDVHRANMSKVRGKTSRGVGNDLVKPVGWIPPRTRSIVDDYIATWTGTE